MKAFLLLFFLVLSSTQARAPRSCTYDCSTEFGNRYGSHNYGGWRGFLLPHFRTKGFAPVAETELCDTPTVLSEDNRPMDLFGLSKTFAVLCSEGIKVYKINEGEISLVTSKDIAILGKAYMTTGFKSVLLSANNEATRYSLVDGRLVVDQVITGSAPVSGPAYKSADMIYAFFEGSIVIKSLITGEETVVEEKYPNGLEYTVHGSGDSLYYCNSEEVVKVDAFGVSSKLDTTALGFECTNILANKGGSVIISATLGTGGSILAEIDTETFSSFDILGTYNFTISGISRTSWNTKGKREAFIGVLSDYGVYVIIEELDGVPRGTIYSQFATSSSLVGRPTLSKMANPVVFDSESIISYTHEHLVKFFLTETVGLPDYEKLDFLPNPLILGSEVVALTTSAKAVSYTTCTRFIAGSVAPEDACPFGELPDVKETPYWMTILSGAAAGLSLPLLGSLLCQKMKYLGDEEDDNVEVELYSEDEYSESEEEFLTPTPISIKNK